MLTPERLRELDSSFGCWTPGWTPELLARRDAVLAMQLRRPAILDLTLPPPTLPSSTLRRALVIQELAPRHVWLDDDVDGLAALLAAEAQVSLPASPLDAWLDDEVRRAGGRALTRGESAQPVDVSLLSAGTPGHTAAALRRALTRTRAGGHIVVRARSPWELPLYELLEKAGLQPERYLRELDHVLMPTGHVLDGAGDLLVLRAEPGVELPLLPDDLAETSRAQPFFWLDLDGLAPERLEAAGLGELADAVVKRSGRSEAMRFVRREEEREVSCWYDPAGIGYTAELNPEHGHLLCVFTPYDEALAHAVTLSAYELFAGPDTRSRPHRTSRSPKGALFS